jgi:hypothetical protein
VGKRPPAAHPIRAPFSARFILNSFTWQMGDIDGDSDEAPGPVLSAEELRRARLRYFTPVDAEKPVASTDAAGDAQDDTDDDKPMVTMVVTVSSDSSFEAEPVPLKRKRPPPLHQDLSLQGVTVNGIVANSPEAVVDALKVTNPHCRPRTRSSSKNKYFRFTCTHDSKGCALNATAVRKSNGSLIINSRKYVAGTCDKSAPFKATCEQQAQQCVQQGQQDCTVCWESNPSDMCGSCSNGHFFCFSDFSSMVRTQVLGNGKAEFVSLGNVVQCTYCEPRTTIDMQLNAKCIDRSVWEAYLAAVTEAAVISEQCRASKPVVEEVTELADVEGIMTNKCPQCKQVFADFSGCLSLTCGAWHRNDEGKLVGCGTTFCGYCDTTVIDEHACHEHLRTCLWNPRKYSVFPGPDYAAIRMQYKRERIWTHVIANMSDKIPAIWSRIDTRFPEINLTAEWLLERQHWLDICAEMHTSLVEFLECVPVYRRCVTALDEMGFIGDAVIRATLLNKGDLDATVMALLANDAVLQSHQLN